VGVELLHADGQTDRHDKADSRFSQFRHVSQMDLFYRSRVTIWRVTYPVCRKESYRHLEEGGSKHFQLSTNPVSEMLHSVRTATRTRLEIQPS
jgi:hypothetical protein